MRIQFDRHRASLALLTFIIAACGGGGSGVAPAVEMAAPVVLSPDTPVGVTGGLIRGALSESNSDVIAFKGIPFAAPPSAISGGSLRRRWPPGTACATPRRSDIGVSRVGETPQS